MQITRPAVTIGWIIALAVALLCLLGLLNVLPFSMLIIFGLIGALAVARLL